MAEVAADPVDAMDPTSEEEQEPEDIISLTIQHHGKQHTYTFPPTATLTDLTSAITTHLTIPPSHQKFLITPKLGLLKPPYPDPSLALSTLSAKKIQLLAPLPSDISALTPPPPRPASTVKPAKPSKYRDQKRLQDSARYTFHSIVPLNYLPNPQKSHQFLSRLASDPGIKAAMAKHKFSVGLLTEMNPAEHTTHESKTLGLNRNRGEVIELRLRTDAYDGYRDYKVIRKTLCHELAHNVHGEHDRKFWDLTAEIEKEVERGDWTRGGKSVGGEEFYNPDDRGVEGGHVDGGGWSGGSYVLGGRGSGEGGASGSGSGGGNLGMSRREIMAKAAEERMKRERETHRPPNGEGA
ncbi:hypothetical protein MMC10_006308 [Thelotrema lepadinum]|nr:hypothetical protein [Thelotrema lepadinum]